MVTLVNRGVKMARQGQGPENPVCVASVIVLDPTERQLLVGARCQTPNEDRHLRTISTFTRAVARPIFRELSGGDPALWTVGANEKLSGASDTFNIGKGEHGGDANTFAVESVLGKVGLAEALIEGAVTGRGQAVLRSLTRVPDKDTELWEWTAMLHYKVVLDSGSDLSKIPEQSVSYDPIVWVEADRLPEAYAKRDASALGNSALDPLFLCLTGACMGGAAYILTPETHTI